MSSPSSQTMTPRFPAVRGDTGSVPVKGTEHRFARRPAPTMGWPG